MSELKVYHCNEWHNEYTEFYLKSEADKLIAHKDAEIAQLQAMLEERNKQVGGLKDRIALKQSDKTLQELLNEVCKKHGVSTLQDLDWAFCESEKRRTKDNIDTANILRHHKYKRCLNNAWWLLREEFFAEDCHCEHWVDWAIKWYKRWLELAEKFKSIKEYENG